MPDFEVATETGQVMIVTIEDKKIYKRKKSIASSNHWDIWYFID